MFPNFKREHIQVASLSFMFLGVALLILHPNGWELAPAFGFVSLWVLMMSESMLLSRVQAEMGTALEGLRKKQEIEVQDLLFYLRQSELGNSPWSNVEAAKNHISKLGLPAIITDSGGACIAVNDALTVALGYNKEIVGELCHGFHRPDIYGEYVQGIQVHLKEGKRFMHSRLTMIDANSKEHNGTVAIIFLSDMRTAVGIWLPDELGILKSL